jgi:hypothetical protein
MPTPQQILSKLVAADDELTNEYGTTDNPAVRRQITICANAIETVIMEIIRADLHRRTEMLKSLTNELNSATAELEQLKKTIGALTQAGQIAQKVVDTLTGLLPFL